MARLISSITSFKPATSSHTNPLTVLIDAAIDLATSGDSSRNASTFFKASSRCTVKTSSSDSDSVESIESIEPFESSWSSSLLLFFVLFFVLFLCMQFYRFTCRKC